MKVPIISLFILSLFSFPVNLISPKLFQILVDEVIGGKKRDILIYVIIGLFGVYLLKMILDSLNLYFTNKTVNGFTLKIRLDIWRKFSIADYVFIERKESGDLKMRLMDDVNNIATFIKEQVIEYIYNILLAIAALTAVLLINPMMTLLCIWVLPILFIINAKIAKGSRKINEEIRTVTQGYYTSTNNSLRQWREIRVQNADQTFIKRFKHFRDRLSVLGYKNMRYWFYNEVFGDFKANYLSKAYVYCIGIYFILNHSVQIGEVIMFGEYFGLLFNAVDSVNTKNASFRANEPYYSRITDTLGFPSDYNGIKPFKFEKTINIAINSFAYPNTEKQIFKNMQLTVNKGDFICLTGESGCGKTTLIKLIAALYKLDFGSITFDDTNILEISKNSLYENIGLVMQDSYLFNTTIRENLLFAKPDATEDELIKVCEKTAAMEFINKAEKGLDTVIGEKGQKLSGGQRQRLCIARALLKNVKLLILDEATSSLDQINEDEVLKSFRSLADDVTIIFITHKPSVAFKADKVYKIADGEIMQINKGNVS